MNDSRPSEDHAAVDGLLPWYVNRTLGSREQDRVREHLAVCRECRENVELLSAVEASLERTAAIPMLPPRRPERLLARLDGDAGGRWRRYRGPVALAASLAGAAVLAGYWMTTDSPVEVTGSPVVFETATSGTAPASIDYVLELTFEPRAADADRDRVLQQLDAREPRAHGHDSVRVTVSLPAVALAELEEFTAEVERLPEVRAARVVAVQLPTERPQ